jgi:hypothetical protein
MSDDTQALLAERGNTHGDWKLQASIARDLKCVVEKYDLSRAQVGGGRLEDFKREALDMIQHKISRILAGNSNHLDHWDDIAGYAVLVRKILAGVTAP